MRPRWVVGLILLAVLPTERAHAQRDARLVEAVRLARDGLGDSARAVAGHLLAATTPGDRLYPEALYTVAVVAATAEDKRLHLQRLAVEFSQSEWADDARLELAQLDYAARDLEGAVRQVDRLLSAYPQSPVRARAALWGARAAYELRNFPLACQWAALGLGETGDEVELRQQLDFQLQRCEGARQGDSAVAPVPAEPATGTWFVQVAAFRTREQAERMAASLRDAGIASLVVPEDGFLKVRAGPYASREQATAALPAIRDRVGRGPFVVQVP